MATYPPSRFSKCDQLEYRYGTMKTFRPTAVSIRLSVLVVCASLISGCLKGLVLCSFPATDFTSNPTRIKTSGLAGRHAVAIVCSKELWDVFLIHKTEFVVTVEHSTNLSHGEVVLAIGESSSLNCDRVPDSHLLFYLNASDQATILLTLPEALLRQQNKEWRIIVFSSPSQRLEL